MSTPWLFVVDVTVDPSVEDEWNTFYDDVHLPEVVACPGFASGTRYESEGADGKRHYLAVYEVSGPEVFETPEFKEATGWGKYKDQVQGKATLYRARGASGA